MACYYKFFEQNWIIDSQEIVHSTKYSTCNFFCKEIIKPNSLKKKVYINKIDAFSHDNRQLIGFL